MRFVCCFVVLLTFLLEIGLAFDLNCSIRYYDWRFVGSISICITQNLKITKRGEVVNPSSIDIDDKVKAVAINHQTVHFIPSFTDEVAQRLEVFEVVDCHLKIVTKENLRQFPRLVVLSLFDNDLEWLDGDLLDFNPKLEGVWFHDNNLKFIGANLLDSLKNLKRADFDPAGCINFYATSTEKITELKKDLKTSCKDESTELKMLSEENKATSESYERCLAPFLSRVDTSLVETKTVDFICDQFSSETKVCKVGELAICEPNSIVGSIEDKSGNEVRPEVLAIQGRAVTFLPMNLAQTSPALRRLEVSKTGIFAVKKKTFKSLANLESLLLTDNKILEITSGLFEDLKSLTELDLSRNRIDSIACGAFSALRNLKILNLSHNKLSQIDANMFSSLTSLERLDISFNRLSMLPVGMFVRLSQLTELRLSHNEIRVLDSDVFSSANAIKFFSMSNNELEFIDSNVLKVLAEADEIDLSGNICVDLKLLVTDTLEVKMTNEARIEMECFMV